MDELPPPPSEPQNLPASPVAAPSPAIAPGPSPSPRRRLPIILIVVGALILVLGGVGAVIAANGGDSASPSSPAASAPSPTTAPPSTPTNLQAAAGAFQVKLRWHPGTEGAPVTRYDIRRNGDLVAQAKASASSYTDTAAVPGVRYTYTVTAVGADEQRAVASVKVTTKKAPRGPPRSSARSTCTCTTRRTRGSRRSAIRTSTTDGGSCRSAKTRPAARSCVTSRSRR